MTLKVWIVAIATSILATCLTMFVRRFAIERGILDLPNSRSSHVLPTPRGGGLAIVISSVLGVLALTAIGSIDLRLSLALIGGGVPIAWVGYMDDRGSISVRKRFALHVAAAVWAVYILEGVPPLKVGTHTFDAALIGDVLGVIAIVWTLNLFNFMDGIDGIAAMQAVFMCLAGFVLAFAQPADGGGASVAVVIAAASLGFLAWNWPPAKIFMGDVGSGYLGYAIAIAALASARSSSIAIFQWLIVGGVFFVDATLTLVRRVARGEKASKAHRSHAYQWLSRRWQSHNRVTLLVLAINLCWLLPLAIACRSFPNRAVYILLIALVPLVVLAAISGAGRAELNNIR